MVSFRTPKGCRDDGPRIRAELARPLQRTKADALTSLDRNIKRLEMRLAKATWPGDPAPSERAVKLKAILAKAYDDRKYVHSCSEPELRQPPISTAVKFRREVKRHTYKRWGDK